MSCRACPGASGANLYIWNDSYWQLQTDVQAKRHALAWLQLNNRTRATEQTAKSCHKTALLLTQPMPPKPDRIVVPAGDQWFVMDDEFDWCVEAPDRKVGITHGIRLNARPFPGYYNLAPVPADSLFGRYQVAGKSNSGSPTNWRQFKTDKMAYVRVLDQGLHGGRMKSEPANWDRFIAIVN